jgi:ribosomal protein S13
MPTMRKSARRYIVLKKLDKQLRNQYLDIDETKLINQSINSAKLVEKDLKVFEKKISEFIKEIGKTKGE